MAEPFARLLHAALPLTVDQVSWGDEVLTVWGPGWSLGVTCAWRLVGAGLVVGWESVGARAAVERVRGLDIVGCEAQSSFFPADPRFLMSDGTALELFSAHDLEPWVMTVGGTTFAASPTGQEWVGRSFAP
ncbi:hypothetical protein [Saccharothrix variisporea]|uniref:Uncharacterized protein n=1 Tax=Saccharothrix variisporea TaxID=543527 RepID=A0A495XFY0_9PSEU|nr:hypothetical protein [Saccharothrix variisporea]RKT72907.1 hypothetical protein DFJ66_6231 [Saccharothrix variisporea]